MINIYFEALAPLLVLYYAGVLWFMYEGAYTSKRTFLIDLIPFGACIRLLYYVPVFFKDIIVETINNWRRLK
jgi:hypothetical protein